MENSYISKTMLNHQYTNKISKTPIHCNLNGKRRDHLSFLMKAGSKAQVMVVGKAVDGDVGYGIEVSFARKTSKRL